MPTTTSITGTSTAPTGTGTAGSQAGSTLGKDDFLKLLSAQLAHQDPMSPVGDQEFMGQMAQFSSLEQITNLTAATEKLAGALGLTQSVTLIGRTVRYADADGNPVEGTVDRVVVDGGETRLVIGDAEVAASEVIEVR